jgi:hypothetical protein
MRAANGPRRSAVIEPGRGDDAGRQRPGSVLATPAATASGGLNLESRQQIRDRLATGWRTVIVCDGLRASVPCHRLRGRRRYRCRDVGPVRCSGCLVRFIFGALGRMTSRRLLLRRAVWLVGLRLGVVLAGMPAAPVCRLRRRRERLWRLGRRLTHKRPAVQSRISVRRVIVVGSMGIPARPLRLRRWLLLGLLRWWFGLPVGPCVPIIEPGFDRGCSHLLLIAGVALMPSVLSLTVVVGGTPV